MGGAEGRVVAVLAVSDDEAGVTSWPIHMAQAFEAALEIPDVLRCRWIVNEQSVRAQSGSVERRLRGAQDDQIGWAVLLDANHHDQALQALAFVEERIGFLSTTSIQQRGTYDLVYTGTHS